MSVKGTKIPHHVLSEDAQMESAQPDAATEYMVITNFIHGYIVILIIVDNTN